MSKRATHDTGYKAVSLAELVSKLRGACNPLAEEAARRLLAADATFKELASMADKERK